MRSIKMKLVLAIGLLIVLVFTSSGFFLIQQKRLELSEDLFFNAISFAELTNAGIIQSFQDFYLTQSFLHFNRDISSAFSKTVDIRAISIVNKKGELLYDSISEDEKQYQGGTRQSSHSLDRIKDVKPSILFADGSVAYAIRDDRGEWRFVNQNEEQVAVDLLQEIENIIFPHQDLRYSVVYGLSYEHFRQRILGTIQNILIFVVIAILLAIVVSFWLAGKLVKPIRILEEGTLHIQKGKLGHQVAVTTRDEIGRLTQTFNTMSKELKKNTEELLIKEKLTAEINLAKEIQDEMLPDGDPEVEGLEMTGSLVSAEAIGGDLYDFLQPTPNDTYILIADVTGHGVPASLVAAITNSLTMSNADHIKKPHEILSSLNKVLHAKTKPNMFATALLCHWEKTAKSFSYCSAGHDQIIHYQAKSKKAVLAKAGGIALGMIPDVSGQLKEEKLILEKDDYLVLYTDGYPEAWRSKDENLGMQRLIQYVEKVAAKVKDVDQFRDELNKIVNDFRAGYEQQDDMTLVVVQRTDRPRKQPTEKNPKKITEKSS